MALPWHGNNDNVGHRSYAKIRITAHTEPDLGCDCLRALRISRADDDVDARHGPPVRKPATLIAGAAKDADRPKLRVGHDVIFAAAPPY